MNPKKVYKVGYVVRIRITARDNTNALKRYGGDYLRVKLYTAQTRSSWAIDVTNDLGNGTYLADVTLRWPGKVVVYVTLVHPSEAIHVLKRIWKNKWRVRFTGRYVGKDGIYEDVQCPGRFIENVSSKRGEEGEGRRGRAGKNIIHLES